MAMTAWIPAAASASAASGTAAATAGALQDGAPGDIVSSAPSAFHPLPGQPTGTKAWKIHYRSTTADGAPNTVSGTVIVPQDGRTGPRPLITYAVGTVGMGDSCAPSNNIPHGTAMEANLIQQLTLRGWAVVVTDYEGLGTPGVHTYTVGPSAGHAVLDAARAAQRLPQAGLSATGPVAIMGYSQGGQASSWAAELQGSYAPELQVKGTATGGVPADLLKVADFNNGSYGSGLIFMAAAGQDAAFPELKLDSYLNPAGKVLVGAMKENCVAIDAIAGSFKRISDLTTRDPLAQPDWQARLNQSRLGRTAPAAPVYQYHALADELIPYAVGSRLRSEWCARGANVEFDTIWLGEHVSGVITQSPAVANWLADRFAGRPTRANC
ncbi:lipase family protein [Streptomyces antarcticus]|uniref:lipase family protein n=1 Tax=Streptomyces antarcticus TaxID=2996458 RepID=UPI002271CAC5|nr:MULTISPECIES: lipase family protein [unclassified Streptomyces]MCY0945252.1 lipase [Streptomyces sp. H34-AA3]MCY0953541.1 lipase [Streptomyces sp. H27-S2]MCZ4083458.1 lipase [Streptomyces sp. H34-S5]